jgi:beta-N-acetylhexosaminidase
MVTTRTGAALLFIAVAAIAQTRGTAPNKDSNAAVRQWMASMTLRDKAAQLISMACYGEAPATRSADFQKFRHWVRDLRIGGLIVNNRVVNGQVRNAEPYAMAVFLNRMQKLSRIPLIVQGDFERGASMRVANTTKFPYNMAYGAAGDVEASRYEGAETAREARALGVHWLFAPDADVNNNPDNPIINIRSYGEDPRAVAAHVSAYIEGAHSDPNRRVLVTAKHFPGHGDTATDSHLGLPRLEVSRDRMNDVELVPFKAAIEHNVDSIMTAHMAVPAVEPESVPATVSEKVITGLLRNNLGFKGIIITDAMDMQGLTKQFSSGEAAVRALEAGVDMLLMPPNPEQAIEAVVKAIQSGRLSRKRIDRSVAAILAAKVRVGLNRHRTVDLEEISDVINNPDASERAQAVADHAVTLVRNEANQIPLRRPAESCVIVLTENRYSQQGRQFIIELRKRAPAINVRVLDPSTPQSELIATAGMAGSCKTLIIAAFITVSAFRGDVALPGDFTSMVKTIIDSRVPVALVAFGNPYLLRNFPNTGAYMATFSTAITSEIAAAKALLGEIPIRGRLPVTIPGYAKQGDGIQLESLHP